jgi:hypothetical protein
LKSDKEFGALEKAMGRHNAPCSWRIHKIKRQSASGTTRDSASASDTKQSGSVTQVRQDLAGVLLTPRASGAP